MAPSSDAKLSAFEAFQNNTLEFLQKNVVEFAPPAVPPEYLSDDGSVFRSGRAVVKLLQTPTPHVDAIPNPLSKYGIQLEALPNWGSSKEAIDAFVLACNNNVADTNRIPFVDIPRKDAPYLEGKFLFTLDLSGCSVIVTRLNDYTFRVYHDRRMNSAVLYDDVEMYVDYDDYRMGGRYLSHKVKAFSCMQYVQEKWKMYLQRQIPVPDTKGGRPNWEPYVIEQKGPLSAEALEKVFNDRRADIQNRIKFDARILKVDNNLIDGALDGVVVGVEFNMDAIGGWKALRDAIQIQIDRQKGIDPSLKNLYYRFEDDVRDSKDIDETWIWLQLKKNKAGVQH